MAQPEDTQLVRRTLAGERSAFAGLVERYADTLSSLVFLRVKNAEDAREPVQQAFFTAYRDLSSLNDAGRFGPWITAIALNLARVAIRRRGQHRRFMERQTGRYEHGDASQAVTRWEAVRDIRRALAKLDDPHRDVVMLYYLRGEKTSTVADMVGRPVGSVKRMLSEARQVLRKELIEMARQEFEDYRLTDRQRERLARIADFPVTEPKIVIEPLPTEAPRVRMVAAYGTFVELRPGAEVSYADYDHPEAKLESVSHVVAEGPIDIEGEPALRINDMDFSPHGKAQWSWRPHFRVQGDTCLLCATECGPSDRPAALLTPSQPGWDEPVPRVARAHPWDRREAGR
jgi:RNA polymerase sigma-70 factor (ECF subfamily)